MVVVDRGDIISNWCMVVVVVVSDRGVQYPRHGHHRFTGVCAATRVGWMRGVGWVSDG